tara:strand:- start:500 stop:709 length:210 start_codon:yes stop_codon:yes gene_type:complete
MNDEIKKIIKDSVNESIIQYDIEILLPRTKAIIDHLSNMNDGIAVLRGFVEIICVVLFIMISGILFLHF